MSTGERDWHGGAASTRREFIGAGAAAGTFIVLGPSALAATAQQRPLTADRASTYTALQADIAELDERIGQMSMDEARSRFEAIYSQATDDFRADADRLLDLYGADGRGRDDRVAELRAVLRPHKWPAPRRVVDRGRDLLGLMSLALQPVAGYELVPFGREF